MNISGLKRKLTGFYVNHLLATRCTGQDRGYQTGGCFAAARTADNHAVMSFLSLYKVACVVVLSEYYAF